MAEGNTRVWRGRERFLTSRRAPGTPRRRQWRDGGPGRRWRTSAAARRTAGIGWAERNREGERELGRVPGCGRRGGAHRGKGRGGAPTATGNRARDGGGYGGGARASAQRGGGGRGVCWCAKEGGGEGEWGSGLKWPGAGRLRAPRATWARRRRPRAARAAVTRGRRG
ncbi:hypothetical protein Zm00014a_039494 [Zea mays]|uniref:Uncharacterized protein n=1 Tax=Zea mays TaxID=4577 RepID=A0A3L6E0X8_MAIZE|nr:hypothetical protein Zm00014a_039494 [Zea mays]